MLKHKGMAANPGRFASDYEEWTDWDGPRAPPFRPSAGDLYAGFSRADDPRPGRPIPHPAPERENIPSLMPTTSHFEDTISKQITSPALGARPIWLN